MHCPTRFHLGTASFYRQLCTGPLIDDFIQVSGSDSPFVRSLVPFSQHTADENAVGARGRVSRRSTILMETLTSQFKMQV